MIQHFSFCCICNVSFFYSGYIIKPPQTSSAIYGAPPFAGHPCNSNACVCLYRSLKLFTDDQVTLQQFNSKQIVPS